MEQSKIPTTITEATLSTLICRSAHIYVQCEDRHSLALTASNKGTEQRCISPKAFNKLFSTKRIF